MRKHIATATAAVAVAFAANHGALADSQGYVVSNWAPAMNNFDESGCPEGKNALANEIAEYTLKSQGMPQDQIQKLVPPNMSEEEYGKLVAWRGRKDGQPVNVYIHPLSVPDPQIRLDQAKEGFGFNLDGKVNPLDYVDAATKEVGVDNAAARVFGCFDRTRGTRDVPSGNWSYRWSNHYNAGNSWLLTIDNQSDRPLDFKNEDSVTVTFYRGQQKPMLNAAGYQRNASYTIDPNKTLRTLTAFKGKIRNGEFISDVTPQFRMIGSSRIQPIFDFKSARMRMEFKPDGSIEGFVGGYMPIKMIYFPFGDYAYQAEYAGGMDVAGVYHALRKYADSDIDIDPKTGNRTRISQTYQVLGVPAFVSESPDAIGVGQKVAAR